MTPDKQKPKSEYNVIAVYVRGDREYIDDLKSKAASAHKPLADFIRDNLDKAIACPHESFFEEGGS